MGTLPETWRKAYGAIKDQTKVGLAHVNSDFKDMDVAIVKATNHVLCPPKERHLRKILVATSSIRPRADVSYCMHALARRLAKTHNWTVALKTLIVIHRTLREGDPTFREELLNFHQRLHILQMSNFKDDSTPIAWDCSAWVRTYALFLEERLECFKILKYDIEAERLSRPADGQDKGFSRTRDLESGELLEQLPALQQLLYRLIGCRPEGAAVSNYVIQYALALGVSVSGGRDLQAYLVISIVAKVLKESFKIYCAINDGIINLVDKFFEMPRHEAIKALDIYKRAGLQALSLSDFYDSCKELELARNFQFPALREPPQSFLVTMEEYIREAPRMVSMPMTLDNPGQLMLTYKEEDAPPAPEEDKVSSVEPDPPYSREVAASTDVAPVTPPPQINLDTDDLLGLNAISKDASVIEETNALALAIVPSGAATFEFNASQVRDFDPTGWELALLTAPSTNLSSVQERQLGGGLDSLTLNSLYDEGAYRASQVPVYGAPAPNPFEVSDPFSVSHSIPTPVVQMPPVVPLQTNPFMPFQPTYPLPQQQQQQHLLIIPQNQFGDTPFGTFPPVPAAHPQTTNPFGSTGIIPQNQIGDTPFGTFPPVPAAHPQTTNPFGSTGLL